MCRAGNRGERGSVFQYDSCPQLPASGSQIDGGHGLQTARRPSSGRLQRGRPGSVKLRLGPVTGGHGHAGRCDVVRCVFVGGTRWRDEMHRGSVGSVGMVTCVLLRALPSLLDAQWGSQGRESKDRWMPGVVGTLGIWHPPLALALAAALAAISIARFNPRTASLGHEPTDGIPACNARDAEAWVSGRAH